MRFVHHTDDLTLIEGDALSSMAELKAGSIDAIITDPAYWTLEKWRNIGTTTRLGGKHRDEKSAEESNWFRTISETELLFCLDEFARLLPKDGHAWIMCDGTVMPIICYLVQKAIDGRKTEDFPRGLAHFDYVKPYPVYKRAKSGGFKAGMGYHGRAAHEYIVLLEKGRRKFPDNKGTDVFEVDVDIHETETSGFDVVWNGDSTSRKFTPDGEPYPTAKPVDLYRRLITLSTLPGERILDPFAGSGTAGEAARQLNRKSVLIDVSKRSIQTIENRLINQPAALFT